MTRDITSIYDGPKRERDEIDGVLPPEFSQHLFGHSVVWDRLVTQLEKDKLPGGIMLHGPRGIGKATLAFNLATKILEHTGDEPIDRVRQQVAQGSHPNVSVLRIDQENGKFKTATSVDSVRKLIDSLHQTRGRVGHRIAIIDAAEDCNRNAMNALLKILEEPPAECHFILVSHQPGRLLPTIKSRCQAYALRELNEVEFQDLALKLAQDPEADVISADLVAIAKGNPRTLFELLEFGDTEHLAAVTKFLNAPSDAAPDLIPQLAQTFASKQNVALQRIVRAQIFEWISTEAKLAAGQGAHTRFRLASASALWDKATTLFTQTDTYNLDLAATYLIVFEAIKNQALLVQEEQPIA